MNINYGNNTKVCCRFKNRISKMDNTLIKTYIESDHLDRYLFRCNNCGCLYLYEFYEIINWGGGDDSIYCTSIHVEDEQDADKLAALDPLSLMFEIKTTGRPYLYE